MNRISTIAAMTALSVVGAAASAQASMSVIERRVTVQRACQAAIWAMPAVDVYDIAHAIRRDLGGETGDVVWMSRPMVSRHGFSTANDVTPYSVGALTTKDGPLVVELPPATERTTFFGTFVDSWMRPVADVGPTGFDEGKGGKYLFLPPGYEGAVPEGYFAFPLGTFGVHFAFRPVSRNGGTVEEAAAYSRRVKVYPQSKADNPPPTRHIDAFPKAWNTLPVYDITFFEDIWNVVQREPVLERDKAMMGLLASIGIVKGQPFAPAPELKAALEEGAQCAFEYLQDRFTTPGRALVPYWGGKNQWQIVDVPRDQIAAGFPFETGDRLLVDARAMSYFALTYWPKKLGGSTFYLFGIRDAEGRLLNGTDTYRLRVPGDTPVRDFWSVIVYSMKTKGFVEKVNRVGLASTDQKMAANDDGSVDVCFAPKPPTGLEGNLVPTGEDFFLIFRFYGPESPVLEKTWVLADVEKVR